MKRRAFLLAMTAAVLMSGCVPALHPLYTEQDLIFDAALIGVWQEVDAEGETWDFARTTDDSYRLVYTDEEGRQGAFQARLLRIEGTTFLDLYPEEPALAANDFYAMHLLRAHSFLLVDSIEPELRIRAMDPAWLEEYLEQAPGAIAHEVLEGGIVLTASTRDLQRFVLEHLETDGAFSDASTMHRLG